MTKRILTPVPRLRMKLLRLRLFHVAVAAAAGLLIAYAVIGLVLLRQSQALLAARGDTAIAQRALRNSTSLVPVEELEQKLTGAKAQLALAQAAISREFQSASFVEGLFSLAESTGVKLTRLQTLRSREEAIGQHRYNVAQFTLSLEGLTPLQLVTFLYSLERTSGQTLVIRSAMFSTSPAGTDLLVELDIFTRMAIQPIKTSAQENIGPQGSNQ